MSSQKPIGKSRKTQGKHRQTWSTVTYIHGCIKFIPCVVNGNFWLSVMKFALNATLHTFCEISCSGLLTTWNVQCHCVKKDSGMTLLKRVSLPALWICIWHMKLFVQDFCSSRNFFVFGQRVYSLLPVTKISIRYVLPFLSFYFKMNHCCHHNLVLVWTRKHAVHNAKSLLRGLWDS